MECRLEEGSLPACRLAHLPRSLLCSRWYQAQKGIQGTQAKTCSVQRMLETLQLASYPGFSPFFYMGRSLGMRLIAIV